MEAVMEIRTIKHGNSIGFNLPSSLIKSAGIGENQRFELSIKEDGALLLVPLSRSPRRNSKYTAAMLLEGIPAEGLHYEDVALEGVLGQEADWQ